MLRAGLPFGLVVGLWALGAAAQTSAGGTAAPAVKYAAKGQTLAIYLAGKTCEGKQANVWLNRDIYSWGAGGTLMVHHIGNVGTFNETDRGTVEVKDGWTSNALMFQAAFVYQLNPTNEGVHVQMSGTDGNYVCTPTKQ
jgi:hypothetical protein